MPASDLTIRPAHPGDAAALERLAARDSTRLPRGALLLAEMGGEVVAALPVAGGPAVADPFRRTEDAVRLLEVRVAQLGAGAAVAERGRRRPALARAATR